MWPSRTAYRPTIIPTLRCPRKTGLSLLHDIYASCSLRFAEIALARTRGIPNLSRFVRLLFYGRSYTIFAVLALFSYENSARRRISFAHQLQQSLCGHPTCPVSRGTDHADDFTATIESGKSNRVSTPHGARPQSMALNFVWARMNTLFDYVFNNCNTSISKCPKVARNPQIICSWGW